MIECLPWMPAEYVRSEAGGGKMKDRENLFYKRYGRDDTVQSYNAYLTVYLALCLMVILSLFLALIDGAPQ